MKNNLVNKNSIIGEDALPLNYTNHAEKAINPTTNIGKSGDLEMSIHSRFDFIDDTAVFISGSGRRVLHIKSNHKNAKSDSSDRKIN